MGFHPLYLFLLMGVNGAFLAGDLFNLYVFFEVLLMASFVLLTIGGQPAQTNSGIRYVVLNLLASTVFLVAAGIAYGTLGTLNFAQIAERLPLGFSCSAYRFRGLAPGRFWQQGRDFPPLFLAACQLPHAAAGSYSPLRRPLDQGWCLHAVSQLYALLPRVAAELAAYPSDYCRGNDACGRPWSAGPARNPPRTQFSI